jgi:hypothetical protein
MGSVISYAKIILCCTKEIVEDLEDLEEDDEAIHKAKTHKEMKYKKK